MSYIVSYLIIIAILLVAAILLAGLLNMARKGSLGLSQQLMRWRVGVQFLAVCLIMVSFYLSGT
ncbi:MAG: twin transmembrane helix small protein [Hyphomicrobiaceae bacterium]|nr:twin transmembrane helix small protein [Hyphomicrobiaceae bacterium]